MLVKIWDEGIWELILGLSCGKLFGELLVIRRGKSTGLALTPTNKESV